MALSLAPHDIPIPEDADADQVPADLLAMVNSFNYKLVGTALDEADCSARFAEAPVGTIVTLTKKDAVLRKGKSGNFTPIWTGGGWVDAAFTPTGDFSKNTCVVKTDGNSFEILLNVTYSGSDKTAGAAGNIGDTTAGSVDASFAPPSGTRRMGTYGIYTQGMTGSCAMEAGGSIYIMDAWPNGVLSSGANITFSFSGMVA